MIFFLVYFIHFPEVRLILFFKLLEVQYKTKVSYIDISYSVFVKTETFIYSHMELVAWIQDVQNKM
jgi:hypothetical protein